MRKTIIAVYGRAGEGKSSTIKEVHKLLLANYPNAKSVAPYDPNYYGDILTAITLDKVKIGFESQGDPNSRIITEDTLMYLAEDGENGKLGGCDIILCASRTSGQTVEKIEEIEDTYGYQVLWLSSILGPAHDVLNRRQAENIIELIKGVILGQY